MRAIQVTRYGGPEVLELVQVPEPKPVSTEVLVEVHAAGVNPVDYKVREGSGVASSIGSPPFVLGWDVAGVVVDAGYGVTRLRPGDRVFGMPHFPRAAGAYSEYVTAPSLQFARIPGGLDFVRAAALPLATLTIWQALFEAAQLKAGQTVLVHGATGGVGHLAVQLAHAHGARVVATSREHPLHEVTDEVDVVLDLVGGEDTPEAFERLRADGTLVEIAGDVDEQTRARALNRGVTVFEPLVEPDGRTLDHVAELVAQGKLDVAVKEVFPLEQAAEAHRRIERGGVGGKLVLEVA